MRIITSADVQFSAQNQVKTKKKVITSQSRRQSSLLRGQAFIEEGGRQSLKLSTKVAVFKKVSLLIEGAKHVNWGGQAPILSRSQMSNSPPKIKCRPQKKKDVITSTGVQFFARNQVKTKKKVITSAGRSLKALMKDCFNETSQNFSCKNDLTCFHC